MELYEWFAKAKREKKITMAEFAKILGCTRNHINLIILNERLPSAKMAYKIQKITEGKVRAGEIIQQYIDTHTERFEYEIELENFDKEPKNQ